MSDKATDALYLTVTRLIRLAHEGKLHAAEQDVPEVTRLLVDAQSALELAGMPCRPAPQPQTIPVPAVEARPVDRRKDWQ